MSFDEGKKVFTVRDELVKAEKENNNLETATERIETSSVLATIYPLGHWYSTI
jgi:hypothetical protein